MARLLRSIGQDQGWSRPMLEEPSAKKAVALLSELNDELKAAVVVADASTRALARSILLGTIPILEFGAVVVFSLLVARLPLKLLERVSNG